MSIKFKNIIEIEGETIEITLDTTIELNEMAALLAKRDGWVPESPGPYDFIASENPRSIAYLATACAIFIHVRNTGFAS